MESFFAQALPEWVAQHALWTGVFVFVIAMAESLAIVGLILPGTMVMFAVGALVAAGGLSFWTTSAWAVAGAVAGDGASYWLGRHYRMRLRTFWPFRAYPSLTNRGVDFFHRHGGKSVALGRFIGPLRPVVPAVAGMLGMPVIEFTVVNVLSALAWGPLYLLPGMAFGASLGLAAEIAGRLAVFLVLILVLLWLVVWLLNRAWRLLAPRTGVLLYRALLWSRRHPVLGDVSAALIDPEHPQVRGLTVLAITLLLSILVFAWMAQALSRAGLIWGLDQAVFQALRELRTPWADHAMIFLTGMGDTRTLGTVTLVVGAWLAWRRYWQALSHFVATPAVVWVLFHVLKLATHVPRPMVTPAVAGSFSFPSGHAAMGMAVYGFLAALLARELPLRTHALVYSAAGVLVTGIGFSRLYLGVHWLSDVAAGLSLGLAWAAVVAIAYRRHSAPALPVRRLTTVVMAGLMGAVTVNAAVELPADARSYVPEPQVSTLPMEQWWQQEWVTLPALRNDLLARHQHPLTLQWAGALPRIRQALTAEGWEAPPRGASALVQWLRPNAPVDRIPVLTQVHDGHHEALLLTRPAGEPQHLLALRLWPTGIMLQDGGKSVPLWIGNLTSLHPEHPLGLSILRTEQALDIPLTPLTQALDRRAWRVRDAERGRSPGGQGVVLLRPAEPTS